VELEQFNGAEIKQINEAVEVAEDLTNNYFKFSTNEWKKMRYDIRTLAHLYPEEITNDALAQVIKYTRLKDYVTRLDQKYDFYLICLQDHKILEALRREKNLNLLSLGVYIVTHELVHIVRFSKFFKMFESTEQEKQKEESTVHNITHTILKKLNWPSVQFVLESYTPFRQIDQILI
jgi:hypothetical protein